MAVEMADVSKLDVAPGELPEKMAAWVIRQEREGEQPPQCRRRLSSPSLQVHDCQSSLSHDRRRASRSRHTHESRALARRRRARHAGPVRRRASARLGGLEVAREIHDQLS